MAFFAVPARSAYDRLWPSRNAQSLSPYSGQVQAQQAGAASLSWGRTYESAVTALGPVVAGTAPISCESALAPVASLWRLRPLGSLRPLRPLNPFRSFWSLGSLNPLHFVGALRAIHGCTTIHSLTFQPVGFLAALFRLPLLVVLQTPGCVFQSLIVRVLLQVALQALRGTLHWNPCRTRTCCKRRRRAQQDRYRQYAVYTNHRFTPPLVLLVIYRADPRRGWPDPVLSSVAENRERADQAQARRSL